MSKRTPKTRPSVNVSLHAAVLDVIDNQLCTQWHTSRSQAIQRIIIEWLDEHNPQKQSTEELSDNA